MLVVVEGWLGSACMSEGSGCSAGASEGQLQCQSQLTFFGSSVQSVPLDAIPWMSRWWHCKSGIARMAWVEKAVAAKVQGYEVLMMMMINWLQGAAFSVVVPEILGDTGAL